MFNLERRIFRAGQPLPARGRAAVPGQDHRAGAIRRARPVPAGAASGIPALPVARLGVRHPHRPVLVRPEVDPRPAVPGQGGVRRDAGEGPLRRPRRFRCRSRRIIWWWRRSGSLASRGVTLVGRGREVRRVRTIATSRDRPSRPSRNEGAASSLLRRVPRDEPVVRPRQADVLAQGAAFVLRAEQAAALQLRNDRARRNRSSPPAASAA